MELLQEVSKRTIESSSDRIHKSTRLSRNDSYSVCSSFNSREDTGNGVHEDAAQVKTVTIGIIALNEDKYLPQLLDEINQQTYPKKLIEVVLVDSGSTDKTRELMESFAKKYCNFFHIVRVLDNQKRIQAAGWNEVINNMTSDCLIRIDAHAMIPKDFVEKNIECLNLGEYVCGGPRVNVIDENTIWKRTLLTVEQSMFGSGIAPYRRSTDKKKYVNSVFHTCYRREVIKSVGLFNEELLRTEDNEYHYRVRTAGYRICYDEGIHSFYQTRSTLRGMIKQKYGNGYWVGITLKKCPKCLSCYHLVPGIFVASILATGVLGIAGYPELFRLFTGVYGIVCVVLTIACLLKDHDTILDLTLIVIFPLLHISYGLGTIFGIVANTITRFIDESK